MLLEPAPRASLKVRCVEDEKEPLLLWVLWQLLSAQPNAKAAKGSTPLHMVAHLRNARAIDCCELLLKAGAAVNLKTHEYSTPLDVALMRGNRRIVPVFLRAGAEFRYSNLNAYTLRVRDAGGLTRYEQPHLGFEKYAQNHLARITAILAPTPLLPPELVRKILEFWLHAGYYCYY